jgi:Ca2+-binding EF-hand superfamily protein
MPRIPLPASAALALASFFLAPAHAADRAERARAELEKRFTAADADHDGRLTREEARKGMPRVHQNFDAIDGDGDGAVTLADVQRQMRAQRGNRRGGQ